MKGGWNMELQEICSEVGQNNSLDHKIMNAFMDMGKRHRAMLEHRLQDTGVFRGQHHLLMCLARNPDISQKELAKIQNVSTAAVAVSLKRLEKGGYIERVVDSRDNRFNITRITERGLKVVSHSVHIFKETETLSFAGFSEEEKELFLNFLLRAGENIKKASNAESEGN